MAQQKEYTWDDLVAAIGQDFSGGEVQVGADPVERGWIRRFCEPLELECPLHYDDEAARRYGYQGIVAPVSMINQTLTTEAVWRPGEPTRWPTAESDVELSDKPSGVPLPMPPTSAAFATDIEIEYFEPAYVGDILSQRGWKLISVTVRQTGVGFGAFVVFESEVHNQQGTLMARCRNGLYYYNPQPRKEEG